MMRLTDYKTWGILLIVAIIFASCEKREELDQVTVTSTIVEQELYQKVYMQNGFSINPGYLVVEVNVEFAGEGNINGGGVQVCNAPKIKVEQWEDREVRTGMSESSKNQFTVRVDELDPWWSVEGKDFKEDYDSMAYYAPFVIIDGLIYYGTETQILLGDE